jgi:hypothetical protein
LPKCKFGASNVYYLDFRLTPGTVKYEEVPRNVKEVRQSTGLCIFFKSHIKECITIVPSPEHKFKIKKGLIPEEAEKSFQ